MIPFALRRPHKELRKLYEKRSLISEKYEEKISSAGCTVCERYDNGNVRNLSDRFKLCEACPKYPAIAEMIAELEKIDASIDLYIETEYAEAVFNKYSKRKPVLVERFTDHEVDWNSVFGENYDDLSVALKHALVSLIEEDGNYLIK